MSVPKTTADNRVIITGQTDYTVQRRHRKAYVKSTSKRFFKRKKVNLSVIFSSSTYLGQWKNFVLASHICKIFVQQMISSKK